LWYTIFPDSLDLVFKYEKFNLSALPSVRLPELRLSSGRRTLGSGVEAYIEIYTGLKDMPSQKAP